MEEKEKGVTGAMAALSSADDDLVLGVEDEDADADSGVHCVGDNGGVGLCVDVIVV